MVKPTKAAGLCPSGTPARAPLFPAAPPAARGACLGVSPLWQLVDVQKCCVLATRVSVCHVAFGLQRVMNGFNDGALRLRRLNILYGGLGSSARRLRRPRRGCFHQRPLSLVLQLFGSHQRPFLRRCSPISTPPLFGAAISSNVLGLCFTLVKFSDSFFR